MLWIPTRDLSHFEAEDVHNYHSLRQRTRNARLWRHVKENGLKTLTWSNVFTSLQATQARVFLSNERGAGAQRPVSTTRPSFIVTKSTVSEHVCRAGWHVASTALAPSHLGNELGQYNYRSFQFPTIYKKIQMRELNIQYHNMKFKYF